MQASRYDEPANIKLLKRLSVRLRVVFALLCTMRILPSYRRFHSRTGRGDPTVLETLIERLWRDVAGDEMTSEELQSALERVMESIPSEEDGWDEETQPYAEDAASAVAYVLRARLTGDPQEAAWASRCAYEAIDHSVIAKTGLQIGGPTNETVILLHPLVQAELARQQRDLKELEDLERSGSIDVRLSELRKRSEDEAAFFFG
jgi:uncharacterized protein YjaG (DUF416 family)